MIPFLLLATSLMYVCVFSSQDDDNLILCFAENIVLISVCCLIDFSHDYCFSQRPARSLQLPVAILHLGP